MMRDAAVLAADEEHRALDAGGREDAGVVAGAGGELDEREAAALELGAEHGAHRLGHRDGLDPVRRLEAERGDEPSEAVRVGCACVDGDRDAVRDHVQRAGLHVEAADGRHRTIDLTRCVANAENQLRGVDERVGAAGHRHGPVTTARGASRSRSTGPCSMWSST